MTTQQSKFDMNKREQMRAIVLFVVSYFWVLFERNSKREEKQQLKITLDQGNEPWSSQRVLAGQL